MFPFLRVFELSILNGILDPVQLLPVHFYVNDISVAFNRRSELTFLRLMTPGVR